MKKQERDEMKKRKERRGVEKMEGKSMVGEWVREREERRKTNQKKKGNKWLSDVAVARQPGVPTMRKLLSVGHQCIFGSVSH